METTFYEEHSYNQHNPREMLKRNLTLDLNRSSTKRLKFNNGVSGPPVLSSPDLNMLKLGSPELERLIIDQQNVLVTGSNSSQLLFPKNVTEEQEIYAQGFVEALNELHHSDSSQSGGGGGGRHGDYTNSRPVMYEMSPNEGRVKEEPQTVPESSPVSPIDMECQEMIKLERKRFRNRVAASKCRKRKLERIALLEGKVRILKGENAELTQVVNRLKDQVYHLKQELMEHVQSGCHIVHTHQ